MVDIKRGQKRGPEQAGLDKHNADAKRSYDGISEGGISNADLNELFDELEKREPASGRTSGEREEARETPPDAAISENESNGGQVDALLGLLKGRSGPRPAEEARPFDQSKPPVTPYRPTTPRTLDDFWSKSERNDRVRGGRGSAGQSR